jgi:dTDP-4-dehydrorhamnose 3,5-epimerase
VHIQHSQLIDGLLRVTGKAHEDERGVFEEVFSAPILGHLFPNGIRQISHSFNKLGALRGLHLQTNPGMAKMMRVVRGAAVIVHIDANPASRTYGAVEKHALFEEDTIGLYAPPLVARGFLALDDNTLVEYLHSETFNPRSTYTIKWNDSILGDVWHLEGYRPQYIISEKDQTEGISFSEWDIFPRI